MPDRVFTLINLQGGGAFQFTHFPAEISATDAANYEPIDTTGGTKPLFYQNREGQEISVEELTLDRTATGESIEDEIEQLRAMMTPSGSNPAPPQLQMMAGDFKQRVVLKDLTVNRTFFRPDGSAMRASISMTFQEVQAS
jgi:hypothetical protein